MRWVRQEDPDGCGVAVLAMLTGQTFAEVNATVKRDADDHTVKPHEMQRYLWECGYFLRVVRLAVDAPGGAWPPMAFAPMHYLNVKSPTGPAGHWVAMDGDGRCLDPWDPARNGATSAFYGVVYEAAGVLPPVDQPPDFALPMAALPLAEREEYERCRGSIVEARQGDDERQLFARFTRRRGRHPTG